MHYSTEGFADMQNTDDIPHSSGHRSPLPSLPRMSKSHHQPNCGRVFLRYCIRNCPGYPESPSSIVRSLLISPSVIRASNAAASAHQQLSGTSGDMKKSIGSLSRGAESSGSPFPGTAITFLSKKYGSPFFVVARGIFSSSSRERVSFPAQPLR